MAASAAGFVERMQRTLEDAAAREQTPQRRKSKRELREEEQARRIGVASASRPNRALRHALSAHRHHDVLFWFRCTTRPDRSDHGRDPLGR